ncbi:hypothetical protein DKM44_11585 [Deinococcus irradiatisoli]|uniref:Uncharacterized protein n=1 Tax=Deinococcus irradiatisoli TaxID=2202254 RepID=A0A2Z3JF23_9DEIO|nr:hypothetical protein [Deinococcus irradiatisoli]AWN23787.1 hypothetical protein DKM44_11585 [Deinococcus irradiatisoli]
MSPARLLLLPLLCVLLSGCLRLPAIEPRTLSFRAGPAGSPIVAADLLVSGVVPADKLLSIPEALSRAPEGSLLLVCWKDTALINFWGPCSHVARKMGPGLMADQPGLSQRAGLRSTDVLLRRYAVIVIDTGVRPEQLSALEVKVKQLEGQLYSVSGAPDTSYCSDYQNALQRAVGLPDVIPFSKGWNALLPSDALKVPGARVLWVGVNEAASSPGGNV